MASEEPMTHATSASGVTTDSQPVDAGSNPKKRKNGDSTTTLEEDLAAMEKMKREYYEFCRVIKKKYSEIDDQRLLSLCPPHRIFYQSVVWMHLSFKFGGKLP